VQKVAFLRLKSDDVFRNNDVMTAGYAVLINVMDDGDLKRNLKKKRQMNVQNIVTTHGRQNCQKCSHFFL
jgi:hypothetical protein